MSTQKTLDKQTATFVAVLAQNIPDLSTGQMQFFIENPAELKRRLANLQPTMTEYLERIGVAKQIDVIELIPGSDLRIMRKKEFPELGILVSNRHNTCGEGLKLALRGKNGKHELFRAPCGCCNWAGQFSGAREQEQKIRDIAIKAIRDACAEKGVKTLLFHCWASTMKQDVDGLHLVDPYQNEPMKEIDSQLRQAFGWLSFYETNGNIYPLSTLYMK